MASGCPELGATTMFGQVTLGGTALLTVSEKVQLVTLLALSLAVHPILAVPIGKKEPDVTLHENEAMPEPSDRDCISKVAIAPVILVGLMLMLAGHTSVGGAASNT